MSSDIEPKWVDRIPWCTESCPSHDGYGCLLGGEVDHDEGGFVDCRCEPAIQRMYDAITTTRDRLLYLQNLWGAENVTKRVEDCLSQAIEEVK